MAQRRTDVLSVITVISIAGVAVGVMAMIVVLSVMGGFEGDLKTKILGTKTHVVITGVDEAPVGNVDALLAAIGGSPGVVGASPYVESEVMISSPTNLSGVVIKGIDPDRVSKVSDLERNLVDGDLAYLHSADKVRAGRRGLSDPEELDRIIEELEVELGLPAEPAADGKYVPGVEGKVYPGKDGRPVIDQGASPTFRDRFVAGDDGSRSGDMGRSAAPDYDPTDVSDLYPDDDPPDGYIPPLPGQEAPSAPAADYDPSNVGDLYTDEPDDGYIPPLPGQEPDDARPGPGPEPSPTFEPLEDFKPSPRNVPGIIIGKELKKALQVDIGSEVNLVSPRGDMGPTGPIPKSRPYKIVGVFYSGMYEYDTRYVYLSIPAAQQFLNMDEGHVTGIEVKTEDVDRVRELRPGIEAAARANAGDQTLEVRDWQDMNKSLFAALFVEKIVMFLLLAVIIIVASFSIVCILIMVVIEKAREIAVLKSMGASDSGVMRIFIFEGAVIGLLGTLIGIIVGVSLCLIIEYWGIQLDPDVYYISNLPVAMDPWEIGFIAGSAVLFSIGATLYPAWQAAKMNPVDGLRYE